MATHSHAKSFSKPSTPSFISRCLQTFLRILDSKEPRPLKRITSTARFEQLERRQLLAVEVIFDYRYDTHGFFSAPAYRQALEAAGSVIGQSLTDNLSEINPQKASFLDGVERSWTIQFPVPNDEIVNIERSSKCVSRNFLGFCTGEEYINRRTIKPIPAFTPTQIDNLVVPQNAIVVFVGSGDLDENTLASSRTISPSITRISGPTDWQDTVRFRGQVGAKGTKATDFSTWGGSLIFNRDPADVLWHADLSVQPPKTKYDLFSVALHELGHVFGYTDSTASFKNLISSANTFLGRSSSQIYGSPVPLFVSEDGGIGHFAATVKSPTDDLFAAMGPGISSGSRKPFTALDYAGLDDIGWNVSRSAAGIISQNVRGFVRDSNGAGIGGAWIQAACVSTVSPRGCPFFLLPPILGTTKPDGSYTVPTTWLDPGVWSLFSVVNGQVLETKNVNFNSVGQITEVNFTAPASLSLVSSTATPTSQGYLLSGSETKADVISIAALGSKASANINGAAFLTESRNIVVDTGAMPDRINLDFSKGNPVGASGSIVVNAGQDLLGIGGDRLVVSGGTFDVFTYEIAGYNAGRFIESDVNFTEVEFVEFNSNAEVLRISFSDDVPHTVVVSDDDVLNNGKSRLLIDGVHEIDFQNPNQTLRIEAKTPGSSVVFSGVDSGLDAKFEIAAPQIAIDASNTDIVFSKNQVRLGSGHTFSIDRSGTEITSINAAGVSAQGSTGDDLIGLNVFDEDVFLDYENYRTEIPRTGFQLDGLGGNDVLMLRNLRTSSSVSGVELSMESNSFGNLVADFGDDVDAFSISFDQISLIDDSFESESRTYTFANVQNEVELSSEGDNLRLSTLFLSSKFAPPSRGFVINGGDDFDRLTVDAFGFAGTATSLTVNGGSGDDEIYLKRSSAVQTNLNGDSGNDFIRVGEPNLAGIIGNVTVVGGEHDTTRTETQVISVNGGVVEREKTIGDRLEVFGDDADATATISVTGSSISLSSHAGAIDFTRIESISIQNAVAGNFVRIEGTNANQNVTVYGGDAADRVTVADTGEKSFVDILVGAGDDNIDILQTGMSSSLNIWTYDGDDEVTVFSSGSNSSINIETGIGNDRPWIQDTGENSVLRIATDDGDDALILNGTGVGSRTEYFAGAGNERVLVSSVSDHTTYVKGDVWLHGEDDGPEGSSDRLADGLEFYFSAPSGQQNLRLDASTFQRVESDISGVISYDGWESIFVYGSESKDILTIAGVAVGGFVDVRLVGGDDGLTIESTGENSLLSVATGGGVDIVDVVSTGEGSRLQIYTEVSVDEYDLPFGDETVMLRNSGKNSRVGIVTGRGSDAVTVLTTGLGSETEISTEQASDLIDIRGSGAGSTTRVTAGEANDRIIISSDTDGEYMLGGSFYIYGGEHSEAPTTEVSINARGVVVSNFYSEGDTLDLFFNGTSESRDYRLADSVFERTDDVGTGTIFFDGIESLNVTTGSGDDSFVVNNTATHSSVDLRLNEGDDEVVVESTGEDSLLYVETDDGSDQLSVRSTGARSLLRVFTYETVDGAGDDRISILGTGVGSGVEVGTGSGADVFSIEATGRNSVLSAILGEGDDIANIYTVDGALSIRASEGNDTVNFYFPSIGVRDTGFILSKFGALLHGDEGADKLVLHGDQGTFNISDPLLNIAGFDDFQNVVEIGSSVNIDAEMVKAIAPDSGELVVKGDVAGGVVIEDFDLWRMTKPAIRDGHFFLRARYIGTSPNELIIAIIVDRPWQNVLIPEDINGDGKVSALDALNVINELNIEFYSSAAQLSDPIAVANWPGLYFDSTGDGRVTALDALVVINKLNLMDSVGAGEANASTTDLMPQAFLVSTKESVVNRLLQLNNEWKNTGLAKRIQAIDGSKDNMPASSFANVTIITDERDPATNRAVDELLSDLGFVD